MSEPGSLVLVATPIGNLGDLSPRAVEVLRDVDVIAAEDTRRTHALLTHAGVPAGRRLRAVHGNNERARAAAIVEEVRAGKRVAYVTDAGMPGISDPGEHLVQACIAAGLPVEVVPGPSAALTALVLSGFPAARFVFEGFLPRRGRERDDRLATIAADLRTTVVFESPRRLAATLTDLTIACGDERRIAVARELTKLHEEVWRGSLGDAIQHFANAPRGEVVVVIEPGRPPAEIDDDELARRAAELVDEGLPTRAAADELAAHSGVSRRRAYDAVIKQRRGR